MGTGTKRTISGLQGELPYLDQGVAALLTDLKSCGVLDKDVAVRSLRENLAVARESTSPLGRDHWPAVSCACARLVVE
jgi:hypothetical protein